jgi:hypothetical protein
LRVFGWIIRNYSQLFAHTIIGTSGLWMQICTSCRRSVHLSSRFMNRESPTPRGFDVLGTLRNIVSLLVHTQFGILRQTCANFCNSFEEDSSFCQGVHVLPANTFKALTRRSFQDRSGVQSQHSVTRIARLLVTIVTTRLILGERHCNRRTKYII